MKTQAVLPKFSDIDLDQIETKLEHILAENRRKINELVQPGTNFSWQSLMQPLEAVEDHLNKFWSLINHLHSVLSSDKLRQVYHACLPKLADYQTEISHHQGLYTAILSIAHSKEYPQLNKAQRKVIDNAIRDFKLSGIALSSDKKAQFAEISKELSRLTSVFEENVLDATQAWVKHITDQTKLLGIPRTAVSGALQ